MAAISASSQADKSALGRCPHCTRAKVLRETRYGPDDSIRHWCMSCGYVACWKPRMTPVELHEYNDKHPMPAVLRG